jgi:uncharacterized coiled-coil protein SlyX
MASLADLEARVAALEADRADYRAVLAAVGALAQRVSDAEVKIDAHREAINALGEKVVDFQAETRERFAGIEQKIDDHHQESSGRLRSLEDGQAELKDLILQALDRRSDQ